MRRRSVDLSEYGTGIDPKELCQLLTQAAAGLDFLNMQKPQLGSWPGGIQHCNVKPSNLLVFGEQLKHLSGSARTPAELSSMDASQPEFSVYVVEVCRTCSWNHLVNFQVSQGKLNAAIKTYNEVCL